MTLYYFKSLLQNYKNYDKKTKSQEVKKIDKRKSDKERDRDMEVCSMLCSSLDGKEGWGRIDVCIGITRGLLRWLGG